MNFDHTKEQLMVRNMVRAFAEKEIKPVAQELDASGEFPWEIIRKMGSLNLMGMTVPQEWSGAGIDDISYMMAIEEIAKVCGSTSVIMAVHNSVCCYPIYKFGTDAQKEQFLRPLAKGQKLGGFALTEPGAGSDAGAVRTSAVLNGDEYVLNGNKIFITSGSEADILVVIVSTDLSKGTKGLSALIVEKGTPGFTYGSIEDKMGVRASATTELVFENCRISKENLLGEEGRGFNLGMATLDASRMGIAAQAVGIAQGALNEAVKYAKEREQFGRPIGKFQAIQWMLAEMATKVSAARFLVHRAAWLKDSGKNFTKESAMAKLYASRIAREVTNDAVQIHGGYGYTKDYAVERFYREAKITEIYEGTSEVQRMVIAREALR
ncbi:MAG: acyl-CoA dehydrogenase [Candidatus Thermoplasmatota archaeon]|nr:acyl-CoA dehydrogenase [Euryarchaeota archaeon]MBU4031237.1 acyl-CoA dehydrogenase [Candidatus Thermoplasmatota archaeon]MBU4071961.1 acyl-CoA dehydrogenase [Candidatus Thermoplasmatota archaeon]MBU4143623.1 acyl-CoA dehydrogenase [Candidatus Thermoplasmatota archaeon]MBU4591283.1 acyl-CoA dehydrogenase [Candidatus Thermoplasmatota archaeon]